MGAYNCDDDVQATVMMMMMIENDELLFLSLRDEGRERNIANDDGTTRTKTQHRRMRQANGKSSSCQEK